jgi:hypothetical protein
MRITVETPIVETARVQQIRGMFDLPAEGTSRLDWDVRLPIEEKPWHLGLIVGPSGCGKTTIARRLFPDSLPSPQRGSGAGGEGDEVSESAGGGGGAPPPPPPATPLLDRRAHAPRAGRLFAS